MNGIYRCLQGVLAGLLLFPAWPGAAQDLLMVRSMQSFPEAMSALQNAIIKRGYRISRIQRVDVGLTKARYKTDKYRVVFFGKADEVREIARRHPDFIPYLPLKMSIFAEGEQTLVVAMNPEKWKEFYASPWLAPYFDRWTRDYHAILQDLTDEKP